MAYFLSIADKFLFIIILMAAGVLAKRRGWISDTGERDLSVLSVDLLWPCLTFSSIVGDLTYRDVVDNLPLPLLACLLHLTGLGLGLLVCRLAGYTADRRRMLLFHATMNNFLVMALPFVHFLLPEKGTAMLAVANLGSILFLWVVGAPLISGGQGWRGTVRGIASHGMIATVVA
ncbi:MAG: AEC family transporter, partial [Planctomycetes bacterium]|nr:AEC family transporter [Planctomycetota bacterium]